MLNLISRRSLIGLQSTKSIFPKNSILKSISITNTIHTIPQPPGYIVGTVNDAYVPPPIDKSHGSLHWTGERIVTVCMVPLAVLPLVTGNYNTIVDGIFGSLVLIHAYAGFESCIVDYIPARVYGVYHNYAMYLLLFGSFVAGYGIYKIETKEGGIIGILNRFYKA